MAARGLPDHGGLSLKRAVAVLFLACLVSAGFGSQGLPEATEFFEPPFVVETLAEGGSGGGREADAVRDDEGVLHVAFVTPGDHRLHYASGSTGDWHVEAISGDGAFKNPSIAVGGGRVLVAAYEVAPRDLVLFQQTSGPDWTKTVLDADGFTGMYPSLQLRDDGPAHLAYYHSQGPNLRYLTEEGPGQWLVQDVPGTGVVEFVSLQELGGVPFIVYHDTATSQLHAVRFFLGHWEQQVVDSTAGSGWFADVEPASDGSLAIAYRNWDRDEVRLVRGTWDQWTIQVVHAAAKTGYGLRLALDPLDRPAILHHAEPSVSQMTFHAEAEPGVWARGVVEFSEGTGDFTGRVALLGGDPGTFHGFYHRESDGALRHAFIWLLRPDFSFAPEVGVTRLDDVAFQEQARSYVDPITKYDWDFAGESTATGAAPTFRFTTLGPKTVVFTVETGAGLVASVAKTLVVEGIAPSAVIEAPPGATVGVPVLLDGSGSFDPDGDVVAWEWDLGDGSTKTGAKVEHTFAEGVHHVALTVTDDDGLEGKALHEIAVDHTIDLTVEMTKKEYTILEPQIGQVQVSTPQGTPMSGVPVQVTVRAPHGGPIGSLLGGLGSPSEHVFEHTTDSHGRFEFRVPRGLAHWLVPGVTPELASLPNLLMGDADHEVEAVAMGPWQGMAETAYRIVLVPGLIG